MSAEDTIIVRNTQPVDFPAIEELSRIIYPHDVPWTPGYLSAHIEVFPEGQLVAVDSETGTLVGMAASLIVNWDDYDHLDDYNVFTDHGYFTNHDPAGRTLYGAEVIVHPEIRGLGIGTRLYEARQELVERLGLLRIRAGARLAGYHQYADELSAEAYVIRVVNEEIYDPTITFQLRRGFDVLAVVPEYFERDLKTRGYAALIEWINMKVARPEDYAGRNPLFLST